MNYTHVGNREDVKLISPLDQLKVDSAELVLPQVRKRDAASPAGAEVDARELDCQPKRWFGRWVPKVLANSARAMVSGVV